MTTWLSSQNGRPSWTSVTPNGNTWSQYPLVASAYDEVGYGEGGYGQDGYDTPTIAKQGIPQPIWAIEVVK